MELGKCTEKTANLESLRTPSVIYGHNTTSNFTSQYTNNITAVACYIHRLFTQNVPKNLTFFIFYLHS